MPGIVTKEVASMVSFNLQKQPYEVGTIIPIFQVKTFRLAYK